MLCPCFDGDDKVVDGAEVAKGVYSLADGMPIKWIFRLGAEEVLTQVHGPSPLLATHCLAEG